METTFHVCSSQFQSFKPFNRFASFKALRRFKVQGSRVQSLLRAGSKAPVVLIAQ